MSIGHGKKVRKGGGVVESLCKFGRFRGNQRPATTQPFHAIAIRTQSGCIQLHIKSSILAPTTNHKSNQQDWLTDNRATAEYCNIIRWHNYIRKWAVNNYLDSIFFNIRKCDRNINWSGRNFHPFFFLFDKPQQYNDETSLVKLQIDKKGEGIIDKKFTWVPEV